MLVQKIKLKQVKLPTQRELPPYFIVEPDSSIRIGDNDLSPDLVYSAYSLFDISLVEIEGILFDYIYFKAYPVKLSRTLPIAFIDHNSRPRRGVVKRYLPAYREFIVNSAGTSVKIYLAREDWRRVEKGMIYIERVAKYPVDYGKKNKVLVIKEVKGKLVAEVSEDD